nr:zwei Ig domain protein zig-8-like [Cherax quadricarinatus]
MAEEGSTGSPEVPDQQGVAMEGSPETLEVQDHKEMVVEGSPVTAGGPLTEKLRVTSDRGPVSLGYVDSHHHDDNALWNMEASVHDPQALKYTDVRFHDPDQPYFDYHESSNVTALLGKTAVLNCRVKNIGNKTVSWVRHRDIHLLTVGRFTYTSDERFSARHAEGAEDWLLMIHYLQERDAGAYECQVSTTPPVSHLIHLTVVEPVTVILGGPDVYINTGSRLVLTCTVKFSPEPPAFIFWSHDEGLIRGRGRQL